jgi:hypothetical protein
MARLRAPLVQGTIVHLPLTRVTTRNLNASPPHRGVSHRSSCHPTSQRSNTVADEAISYPAYSGRQS